MGENEKLSEEQKGLIVVGFGLSKLLGRLGDGKYESESEKATRETIAMLMMQVRVALGVPK